MIRKTAKVAIPIIALVGASMISEATADKYIGCMAETRMRWQNCFAMPCAGL